VNKIKENKFYLITTGATFATSAFLYFIVKFLNNNYRLIGSKYDDMIPFLPIFIYFYMIWYPFEIFSLYHISKNNLKVYTRTIISLFISFLISTSIFIAYPTEVDRPLAETFDSLTSFVVYVTFKADTPPVNCFPSNHCILCFVIIFAVFSSNNMKVWKKYLIIIINILIIASTLLVKQHVIIDVLGALTITVITYYVLPKFKFFKKLEEKLLSYG